MDAIGCTKLLPRVHLLPKRAYFTQELLRASFTQELLRASFTQEGIFYPRTAGMPEPCCDLDHTRTCEHQMMKVAHSLGNLPHASGHKQRFRHQWLWKAKLLQKRSSIRKTLQEQVHKYMYF